MKYFARVCINQCFLFSCLIIHITTVAQKISGRVLNEGGKPAYYVNVRFKDKSTSVFTNEDGSFAITAQKLPDTLFFSAPGFEPYRVLVTNETVNDLNFEVVLLNTRRKIKTSDASSTMIDPGKREAISANNQPGTRQAGSGSGTGSYIAGKKLMMTDTIASNGSVIYRSGLLTAAEINGFDKWRMWQDFTGEEFKLHSDHWQLYPTKRFCVLVENDDHHAIVGQPVYLIDARTNDTAWSAVSDNTGKAELWASMNGDTTHNAYRIVAPGANDVSPAVEFQDGINVVRLKKACDVPATVDIVAVVDATGSMTNEIDFLKIELEQVLRNTFAQYSNLDLHVGSVFYRDKNDEFVTRHVGFQTDLLKVLNFIKLQRAAGGGDVPEAEDVALQTALDTLHWSNSARTRILFLVTDAPPHDESKQKIFQLIKKAASMGVRIVPVICRGSDKSTEYIMRSMALATNGTYVFLTDDNQAEFVNAKATTGVFNVQFLNGLLEKIIKEMVRVESCSARDSQDISSNVPANIAHINITPDPVRSLITVDCRDTLREVFITDLAGKILVRLSFSEKDHKWTANLGKLPNGLFLVKYINADDQWGAAQFVMSR